MWRSIDTSKLRKDLFGKDKMDRDAEGVYPDFTLFSPTGEIVCRTTVEVRKQQSTTRKPSGHRLLAVCPTCGKKVSVGRLVQHHEFHEQDLFSSHIENEEHDEIHERCEMPVAGPTPNEIEAMWVECAEKCIELEQLYDQAAEADAGFDGGEFSGPAADRACEAAQRKVCDEYGFNYEAVMQKVNELIHADWETSMADEGPYGRNE